LSLTGPSHLGDISGLLRGGREQAELHGDGSHGTAGSHSLNSATEERDGEQISKLSVDFTRISVVFFTLTEEATVRASIMLLLVGIEEEKAEGMDLQQKSQEVKPPATVMGKNYNIKITFISQIPSLLLHLNPLTS